MVVSTPEWPPQDNHNDTPLGGPVLTSLGYTWFLLRLLLGRDRVEKRSLSPAKPPPLPPTTHHILFLSPPPPTPHPLPHFLPSPGSHSLILPFLNPLQDRVLDEVRHLLPATPCLLSRRHNGKYPIPRVIPVSSQP